MMTDKILIKLKKQTRQIEKITSGKGSYKTEYWFNDCASAEEFTLWMRQKFIIDIENDFARGLLDSYQDTYIELIIILEDANTYDFFVLKDNDFTSDKGVDEIITEFSLSISDRSYIFENSSKRTIGFQCWILQ